MIKYLNLTEGYNPQKAEPQDCIDFEAFFFSGGEPHIKLGTISDNGLPVNIVVTTRLNNANDFMMLVVATDALNQSGTAGNTQLVIPYFPGARQDRRMVAGEPLTVKVYADIINKLHYDEVKVHDPHSDVVAAVVDNVTVVDNHDFVLSVLKIIYPKPCDKTPFLISPDSGANKKVKDLAKFLYGYQPNIEVIKCDKTRDVSTGKISGFEVYSEDLQGKDCIIVDDICDGGGTFLGLAKELKAKNAGDLYLVVSHGIFSKGVETLCKEFKQIYFSDSFPTPTLEGYFIGSNQLIQLSSRL